MNINIKVSETMTRNTGRYGNEDALLRIPKTLREQLNLELGQDFVLNSIHNTPVVLTVCPAYKSDVTIDEQQCYVSQDVFNLVNLDKGLQIEPVKTITLGCDPEFFLIDRQTGTLLRANAFFKKWGEIGNDGVLAELRPRPTMDPQALTDNIYELIKETRQILDLNKNYDSNRIELYGASSYKMGTNPLAVSGINPYATTGFHLHYGLPNKILGTSPEVMSLMFKISRIMDYFVGLPCVLIEGSDDKRRTNSIVSYGKPSDFRLDHRTFEYRVPGGTMLRHPLLTKGLLTLGSVVITDIVSRIKQETNGFRNLNIDHVDNVVADMYNTPDLDSLFTMLCSPDLREARSLLEDVYSGLTDMIGFGEGKDAIDSLFNCIKNNVIFNNNIEDNWRNVYESHAEIRGPSHAPATFGARC